MTSTPPRPPPKPVVTIYGAFGAGAKQVGRGVAHRLGLPYFGPAFSSEAIEGGPENVREQEALFLKKMLAVMAATFGASASPRDGSVERHREELIAENIRQVQGCAHLGGVLVGRHGALLLADRPNTVHVLLTGSIADRIERAATESGLTREHAASRLEREDHVRADMSIALFGWDPRTADHYDLVVNTSRIPLDAVVEAILTAVEAVRH
jgi:glucuronide carrier protein